MHLRLVERLLDHEIEQARDQDWFEGRVAGVERDGAAIRVRPRQLADGLSLRFDGRRYDAEPLGLVVVRNADGSVAPGNEWPGRLYFGEHPALKRPFACLRGLFEYHVHFSHVSEPWDQWRYHLRFPVVLRHVLDKADL